MHKSKLEERFLDPIVDSTCVLTIVVCTTFERSSLCNTIRSIEPILAEPLVECKIFTCSSIAPPELSTLLERFEIDLVFYPDKGLYDAMNHAISTISSPYHLFLHDDDVFTDRAVYLLRNDFLQWLKHSGLNAFFFDNEIYSNNAISGTFNKSSLLRRIFHAKRTDMTFLPEMPFNHVGLIISTYYSRLHPYRTSIGPSADFSFILELVSNFTRIAGCQEPIARFTLSPSQLSSRSSFKQRLMLLCYDILAITSSNINVFRKIYILFSFLMLSIIRLARP
jgi:hypothetical protein